MLARFARDAVTYGGTAVIVRAVGLLLLPVYTRFITPAEYGMVDLLLIVAAFAFVTVALEVGQGSARFLPEATAARRAELVSASLAFAIPAYVVFAIGLALVAEPVASLFLGQPDAAPLVRVAAVTIALVGIFQLAHGELRWMMQASRYAIIGIAYVVTGAAVSIALVTVIRMGPAGILLGQAAGAVLGLALVVVAGRGVYQIRWHRERLREMLRFSLPLVPSSVAVILMASADRLIVNSALELDDVGVYGVGLRIASIVGVVMLAFQASLTPLVYAAYRDPETPRGIEQLFRALVVVAGALSIVLAIFPPEVVAVIAAPQFAAASKVVPILATATIIGGMYIFAPGLAIAQRTGTVALVSIGAAMVTTLSGLALIPHVGIVGGAVSALLGGATLFLGHVILGGQYYSIPVAWPRILFVGAVVLAVDAVAVFLDVSPMSALVPRLGMALACIGLIAFLGPITPSDLSGVLARVRHRAIGGRG